MDLSRTEPQPGTPTPDGKPASAAAAGGAAHPERPVLGMWDAVAIIVGIVIGSTIYKSPQLIMGKVETPEWGLAAWALGGVLSLIGALCYAELASTYPRSGGDYVYLSRAFGNWCGFLFGWAQLAVILTSSIAMMGFVFGDYAVRIWPPPGTMVPAELAKQQEDLSKLLKEKKIDPAELQDINAQITSYNTRRELWTAAYAIAAVLVLSVTNLLGVVLGKWTQNLLSLVKVLGLGAIVFVGFRYGQADILQGLPEKPKETSFGMAMVFVLYAYGGWNDAAFVAAEVRHRRSIIRALILGVGIITVIYLAVNVAYLRALGFEKMRTSFTVAADVGHMVRGEDGVRAISLLVMISALGAINGLAFTGSRVYSTLGSENSIFALLGRWHPRLKTPVWALLIQAAITVVMIVAVGTPYGRDGMDWCMTRLHLDPMPWDRYFGGFDTLLSGTAPVFWGFFLLTGLALFALRQRDGHIARPFSVPLYPVLPLIFCGYCVYMLYSAFDWAKYISLIGAIPLLIGLPLYYLSRHRPQPEDVSAPAAEAH